MFTKLHTKRTTNWKVSSSREKEDTLRAQSFIKTASTRIKFIYLHQQNKL